MHYTPPTTEIHLLNPAFRLFLPDHEEGQEAGSPVCLCGWEQGREEDKRHRHRVAKRTRSSDQRLRARVNARLD